MEYEGIPNGKDTYLERNKTAFKNYKYLWENNDFEDTTNFNGIVVEDAKNNSKIFYRELFGTKLYFNSRYHPQEDAKLYLNQFYRSDCTFILFIGLGFAYHGKELLQRMGKEQKMILIELDKNIFHAGLHSVDFSSLISDNRVYFHLYENDWDYRDFIEGILEKTNLPFNRNRVLTIIPPQYRQGYEETVKHIVESTHYSIMHLQTIRNTIVSLSDLWLKNYLNNIKYFEESIPLKKLSGKFQNKPAYVISAGPSLNKNIEELKKIGGDGVIFAGYTALKVLQENNINPDFVVAIDGRQLNYESQEQLNVDFHIPLIYSPFADTRLLKKHKGIKIRCVVSYDHYSKYINQKISQKEVVVYAAGTVAATIMDVGYQMGCNPIVFVGQDLAYTNDKTHAAGTNYDKWEKAIFSEKKDFLFTKDILGGTVKTDPIFLQYKKGMEDYINSKKDSIQFIDATEGGVYIEGTTIDKLSEVTEQYKDVFHEICITKMLEEVYNKSQSNLKTYRAAVVLDVQESLSKLQALATLLEDTLCNLKTISQEDNNSQLIEMNQILNDINVCNETIEKFVKETELFQLAVLGKIYEAEEEYSKLEENTSNKADNLIQCSIHFYEKILSLYDISVIH